MLAYKVHIEVEDLPAGWDPSALDFVNQLLELRPHRRLGFNGAS